MDIRFDVTNQIIKQKNAAEIVNLSEKYLNLVFDFKTDDWSGFTKFILIHHADGVTRLGLIDDEILLSSKYLASRKLKFTLYGVILENGEVKERITTNMIRLPLIYSGFTTDYDEDLDPVIDADVIENIWEGINTKVSISDIQDNLTSTDTDKPLSALQGKELKTLVDGKANVMHTHSKSEITDFDHTHTKSEITDFNHTHSKSEITDFSHNHDERYYTESEVDEIVENLKHDLDNRITLDGDKSIIQTDDKVDFKAFLLKNGVPKADENIYFYVKED